MPLETAELLAPIPGDNPGGEYLRYDPVYDQIRLARTEEEDLPSGDWERERKTADYGLVIRLSREILSKRSKDLQVAAWLSEALLKREGFGGLASGLEVIRGLLDNFWEHLHPELEDDDAELRAAPLVWVGEYLDRAVRMVPIVQDGFDMAAYRDSRSVGYEEAADTYEKRDERNAAIAAGRMTAEEFDASFNATPKSWYRQFLAEIDGALEAIAALSSVSDEKFGRDAPRFSPLVDAIQEVRQVASQLLALKLERDPDPVEVVTEAVVAEIGMDPPGHAGAAVANVSVPGLFGGPPHGTAAGSGGRAGAEANIAAAARFLRKESATNPGAYLMLRGFRWGELRAGGGHVDPALLTAPPTEVRTRVKALLMDEKWDELLEAAEEVMATPFGRGWLDLQRYVVTATDALGEEYAPVGRAVRRALRDLLADLPELPAMALADDTPTANAETRAWLRAEALLDDAGAGAAEDSAPPPPPRRPRFDPLLRAHELASAGKQDQAVDLLMHEAAQERSPRGRFLRRTQAAAILVEAGQPAVALPILEELSEAISGHNLEAWENAETIAEPLSLLYRCHVAIDGDGSSVYSLFERICRLDPLQAMKVRPAQSG